MIHFGADSYSQRETRFIRSFIPTILNNRYDLIKLYTAGMNYIYLFID